jgi:hypothetical protein
MAAPAAVRKDVAAMWLGGSTTADTVRGSTARRARRDQGVDAPLAGGTYTRFEIRHPLGVFTYRSS